MNHLSISRRTLLTAALAGVGTSMTGCGSTASPTAPLPAGPPPQPTTTHMDDPDLAALERRAGGRLGVHALDAGTGTTVSYRAGERFLMASTAKLLLAAAVLDRAATEPTLLQRLVRYGPEALLDYAPVTAENVTNGMTVADLCGAALTVSDNTAANLLIDLLGGPGGRDRLRPRPRRRRHPLRPHRARPQRLHRTDRRTRHHHTGRDRRQHPGRDPW
jgi:beta-lactamase class A